MIFASVLDVPGTMSFAVVPAQRGQQYNAEGGLYSLGRLPTDALFSVQAVLENVAEGSRIRLEDAGTGALVAEGDAVAGANTYLVEYFGAVRTLRAKVRKGTSGTKYTPFESLFTISASGGSLYVSQILDTIA